MPIAQTSRAAYHSELDRYRTQERRLFVIYREHPEGLSDREAAELMGLTCALASARRNGLRSCLKETDYELHMVRKGKDSVTRKTVQFWTARKRVVADGRQESLF